MSYFDWFKQISTALEPWVIGLLGIYIAFNQWRSSKRQSDIAAHRLKLDLFDKRFVIYEAARNYISSIVTNGRATDEAFLKYFPTMRETKWVLDDEVHKYLTIMLYHKALELEATEIKLKELPVGSKERNDVVAQNTELHKWFRAQYGVLDALCDKHMRLIG